MLLTLTLVSCNSFLDTVPDNRTEVDNVTKLGKLVGAAYPQGSYAVNFNARVDFVSDKGTGTETLSNTDAFFWRDVASTAQDSPEYFWTHCYYAIANANEAITSAPKISGDGVIEFVGEAKLARAFSHFLLVTTFARFWEPAGDNSSMGVPYITEPEDVVIKNYERGTVASTYKAIEKDMLEGLAEMGGDAKYTVPRYHFNVAAANVFASRYYMFKGEFAKVVEYASKVIPVPSKFVTTPSGNNVAFTDVANVYALNNFQPWTTDYSKCAIGEISPLYTRAITNSNLLLTDMVSSLASNGLAWRYNTMKVNTDATVKASNPTGGVWAYRQVTSGVGICIPKFKAHKVYSSVNASTYTTWTMFPYIRNEEALLNRAEAYCHLDMAANAVNDLNVYCRVRITDYDEQANVLTAEKILNFYKKQVASADNYLNKYDAYGCAAWSDERKAVLMFVLDCRRNEYMWEGFRYWDLWRYKIPITHTTFDGQSNTLYPGDDRWVLQIPETATLSGVKLNPRTNLLSPEW